MEQPPAEKLTQQTEAESNIEKLSDWREKRDSAATDAEKIAGVTREAIFEESEPTVLQSIIMEIDSAEHQHASAMEKAKQAGDEATVTELNKEKYAYAMLQQMRENAELRLKLVERQQAVAA